MLRYGDGTPFPFEENVLAILEDAVLGCSEMFAAAADLDRQREQARKARRAIDEQTQQLVALERAIASATSDARGGAESVAQRAAVRALAAGRGAIRDAQRELDRRAAVEATEPGWEPIAQRVQVAAARFFEKQSLPNTAWSWRWDVSATAARAETRGHAAPFEVAFELEVAPVWRAPVRLGVLAAGIVLQLPVRRMFGAPTAAATRLDPLFLVEAAVDADGRSVVVRERATPSSGWRLLIPAQGSARCHLIDRDGKIDGPEFELARDAELNRLWAAIETEIATMHAKRRAREILFEKRPIAAIADVTTTPRAILDLLGPIVRAIRAHSRMPGELVLKRDVADGVRAELYISRQAIYAHCAELPPEYRWFFERGGFGRELTEPPIESPAPRFPRASQVKMLQPPRTPPQVPTPRVLAPATVPPATEPRPRASRRLDSTI